MFKLDESEYRLVSDGQLLVFLDVNNSVLAVAEPLSRILSTKSLDECVRTATDLLRKLDHVDAFQNDVVRLHWIRPGERRASQ